VVGRHGRAARLLRIEIRLGGTADREVAARNVILGLGWAKPSEETYGPGLDDEWALEALYRLQHPPNFALMPDLQLLLEPARNPDANTMLVFGIGKRWDLWFLVGWSDVIMTRLTLLSE